MIKHWTFTLHVEWHRGGRPHLYLRRRPRAGALVTDGGEPCRIETCQHCGGDGQLSRVLVERDAPPPMRIRIYGGAADPENQPSMQRCGRTDMHSAHNWVLPSHPPKGSLRRCPGVRADQVQPWGRRAGIESVPCHAWLSMQAHAAHVVGHGRVCPGTDGPVPQAERPPGAAP